MTDDLEILKELFLPLLEEMAPHASGLTDALRRGETFWAEFNNTLLGTPEQLQQLLADDKLTDIGGYAPQLKSLKAEYIASLAQCYCAGNTCPAIALLLGKADAAFMAEVAFQKDLQAAITQAGRAAIRNELKLRDEFTGADISDEEITSAFHALQGNARRDELRKQLQHWEAEGETAAKPGKRKRIGAIPLLFLRLAAAAAVGTVATVGVVKVYTSRNEQKTPTVKYDSAADSNKLAVNPATTDTIAKVDTVRPGIGAGTHKQDTTKSNAAHLHIILKGTIVDTASSELVTDVAITLRDENGKEQTAFSKDGKFRLRLPLHHDFVITGKKDGYHSARLSLSTKDAQDADAGEVVEVVLSFSKDP